MEDENRRKYVLLILIALLVAFMAYFIAQNAQNTVENITNCGNCGIQFNSNELCQFSGASCTGSRVFGSNYLATEETYLIVMLEVSGANKLSELQVFENGILFADKDIATTNTVSDVDNTVTIMIPKGVTYNVSTAGTTATINGATWYEQKSFS